MPKMIAAFSLILLLGMVITRVQWLKQRGVKAMHFGNLDKTDFLIPPIALFYFYTIFAAAFGWPGTSKQEFFHSQLLAWIGVLFCLAGPSLLFWSLVSFGRSFRVGIDIDQPDQLVTTGIFALSRNPIYVAFASVLFGQFLVFPNWTPLIALVAGVWLLNRQIVREEAFMQQHYGAAYIDYCKRVRRYL